jgi:hypothetical protein
LRWDSRQLNGNAYRQIFDALHNRLRFNVDKSTAGFVISTGLDGSRNARVILLLERIVIFISARYNIAPKFDALGIVHDESRVRLTALTSATRVPVFDDGFGFVESRNDAIVIHNVPLDRASIGAVKYDAVDAISVRNIVTELKLPIVVGV